MVLAAGNELRAGLAVKAFLISSDSSSGGWGQVPNFGDLGSLTARLWSILSLHLPKLTVGVQCGTLQTNTL